MERAIFVRMKPLLIAVAALALGSCTRSGSPEEELADSAALAVPEAATPVSQPAQVESVTRAPSQAPASSTPVRRTPAQTSPSDPPVRQPPPPRDTRPSIPYPPDTI